MTINVTIHIANKKADSILQYGQLIIGAQEGTRTPTKLLAST